MTERGRSDTVKNKGTVNAQIKTGRQEEKKLVSREEREGRHESRLPTDEFIRTIRTGCTGKVCTSKLGTYRPSRAAEESRSPAKHTNLFALGAEFHAAGLVQLAPTPGRSSPVQQFWCKPLPLRHS